MRAAAAAAGRLQHARVIVHYQNKFAILRHHDLSADTSEALDAPGPTTLTHINALWFQTCEDSSRLSGSRLKADPLGNGYKLRQ